MDVPKSHPRIESLRQRHLLVDGLREGFVAEAGLVAHGRGEAFDYLLGEKTVHEAESAEKAAVALLLLAENPVISVNGNVAALVPKGIVELAVVLKAKLEVNLFYRTLERERKIESILKKYGAERVFGIGESASKRIPNLDSKRGAVDPEGIYSADVVLVPLEDGDRTEALVAMGKKIIAIDLNPLSRTSQAATIAIVDNVSRAVPNMTGYAGEFADLDRKVLEEIVHEFDNKTCLERITARMRGDI